MNITLPSVSRAILIGLGSGITAPLGIAAGLHCYSVLVGVSRDPSMICQVVCAIKSIKSSDPETLSGGAILYLTQPAGFEWPDEALLRLIAVAAPAANSRMQIQQEYDAFANLARAAFGPKSFPVLELENPDLRAYAALLRQWRLTHSFMAPLEHVQVRIGRPPWGELLLELQSGESVDAMPRSNLPLSYETIPLIHGNETYIRDIHVLYTGARGPLNDIEKWVSQNNSALFKSKDGAQSQFIVHSETW